MCNLSRGPTKHWKGTFSIERTESGLSGTKKDFINMTLQFTYDFSAKKEDFNIAKGIPITKKNGCINMN